MSEVKQVLGISGGKDSAALALYLNECHPELNIEYYTCDTGRELDETYELINRLESKLGKPITLYKSIENTPAKSPFDHFLQMYGGYLPSSTARWCTKKLKLEPFEAAVGDAPTISYVGIRGDEDRDGYISKKENIQAIFPFRKNIWSEDVINKVLANSNMDTVISFYKKLSNDVQWELVKDYVETPVSMQFNQKQKLNALLDCDTKLFNSVVFEWLKTTEYPVGKLDYFPLVENDDNLVRDDIFRILKESDVGVPKYYDLKEYKVIIDGEEKTGYYSRSRSGCFFCFFQQKIEWVWLYENHRDLFDQAMAYEEDDFKWSEEPLIELSKPERIEAIKKEHYLRTQRNAQKASNLDWQQQIIDAEGDGCAACFI